MLFVLLMVILSKFATNLSVTVKNQDRHLTSIATLRSPFLFLVFVTFAISLLATVSLTYLLSAAFGVSSSSLSLMPELSSPPLSESGLSFPDSWLISTILSINSSLSSDSPLLLDTGSDCAVFS